MANKVYPKFKEYALGCALLGTTPIAGCQLKAILIDAADYTYDDAHEFLTSIPSAARVSTSPALGTVTGVNGVLKAANTTFPAVTGDQSEAVAIVAVPGSGATDANTRLVAFIDTGITGAPVTPNGGDINLNFDTGANGIFAL